MFDRFFMVKSIAWLLGILFVLLLIVLPLLIALLINSGRFPESAVRFLIAIESVQKWGMILFSIGWVFFLGGCFASFLNVVAWRVPRGRGILGSSKCPYCNVSLKWGDNLPFVGWIRNGGRCRTCRLPISARYVIAELILGFIFLTIVGYEFVGGGLNLPISNHESFVGIEDALFDPNWNLLRLAVFHLVLLSALFTFALIETDRLPIPKSIMMFSLMLGIGLPMIWPGVLLMNWNPFAARDVLERCGTDFWLTLLVGGLVGVSVGWWVSSLMRGRGRGLAAGLGLVGVFLGWQSVLWAMLFFSLAAAVGFCFGFIRRESVVDGQPKALIWNGSSMLLIATLLHIVTWRWTALAVAHFLWGDSGGDGPDGM